MAYGMAPLQVTFGDLECHFYCLKFLCHTTVCWRSNMWCRQRLVVVILVDHSYGPVDLNKIGCVEVC